MEHVWDKRRRRGGTGWIGGAIRPTKPLVEDVVLQIRPGLKRAIQVTSVRVRRRTYRRSVLSPLADLRRVPAGRQLDNAVNAALFAKLSFDFLRDFAPVGTISRIPIVLVTNPDFPTATVADLAARPKGNPGRVTMGSPTTGTGPFMAVELFKMMPGADLVHVPYRGMPRTGIT